MRGLSGYFGKYLAMLRNPLTGEERGTFRVATWDRTAGIARRVPGYRSRLEPLIVSSPSYTPMQISNAQAARVRVVGARKTAERSLGAEYNVDLEMSMTAKTFTIGALRGESGEVSLRGLRLFGNRPGHTGAFHFAREVQIERRCICRKSGVGLGVCRMNSSTCDGAVEGEARFDFLRREAGGPDVHLDAGGASGRVWRIAVRTATGGEHPDPGWMTIRGLRFFDPEDRELFPARVHHK